VTHTAATSLGDFVTEQLPAPRGAWVLGCILQLTDAEDGARFWWQYAAGAGDDAASYCLYLHHLSLGETDAAAWWRQQARIDTHPDPETVPLPHDVEQAADVDLDSSTPTVLRVLNRLLNRANRTRTEVVDAVMDYVPGAVTAGYLDNPDVEIPLPGPDFADHIAIILAAATALHTSASPQRQPAVSPRLSKRHPTSAPLPEVRVEHSCAQSCESEEAVRGGHR